MNLRKIKKNIADIIGYDGSFMQKKVTAYKEGCYLKKRKELLNTVGPELLLKLFRVASENNVMMWVEFGTMLGAYREHDFIKHDFDIDTGMYSEDYTLFFEDELLKNGFTKLHSIYKYDIESNNYLLTEVTLLYKELAVDIFFSFKDDNKKRNVYVCSQYDKDSIKEGLLKVKCFSLPDFESVEYLDIRTFDIPCPKEPEKTLRTIYGENFMTPDPNWSTPNSNLNVTIFDFSTTRGVIKGFWR